MALDPRINLMAQPVQTMGPVDQMNAMLALQGGLQKNRLIDLQTKKAQIDLESAPALARLNELVKLAEMQKNMRIEQDAAAKAAALREAQNLMQTGGYQPTPEFPNQPPVMLNEQAALEEARRQQAAGQPVRIAVPNQGKLQALLMQANPQQATAELLKQMNPAAQRGVVVPAGGAFIPPGQTSPAYQAPFAPRTEPAPVVRPVPDPNSPTGFSYEDMRRPGTPLATAPAPQQSVRQQEKEEQKSAVADYAESLVNRLSTIQTNNPRSVAGILAGPTRGMETIINSAVPGAIGSEATIARQTKEQLIGILNQLRGGSMGRLSNQDMARVDSALGAISSGTAEGLQQGMKDVLDTIDVLRGKPARSLSQNTGGASGSWNNPPQSGWTADKERRFQELRRKQSGAN